MYRKAAGLDKFEAHIVPRDKFFHSNYAVSNEDTNFSNRSGYMWDPSGTRRGYSYGVEKKMYKVSGHGCVVDSSSYTFGLSDK